MKHGRKRDRERSQSEEKERKKIKKASLASPLDASVSHIFFSYSIPTLYLSTIYLSPCIYLSTPIYQSINPSPFIYQSINLTPFTYQPVNPSPFIYQPINPSPFIYQPSVDLDRQPVPLPTSTSPQTHLLTCQPLVHYLSRWEPPSAFQGRCLFLKVMPVP